MLSYMDFISQPVFGEVEMRMARQGSSPSRFECHRVCSVRCAATGLLALCFCIAAGNGIAQDSTKLFADIARADVEFFDAFNTCDLARMGKIFSEDLEFYHDTGGFTDYRQTMENSKALCIKNLGLRRELVEGSLEVYPIGGYGAIQKGEHTFCHLENGQNDCGTFEFVHVWRRDEEGWRLARVISFGH